MSDKNLLNRRRLLFASGAAAVAAPSLVFGADLKLAPANTKKLTGGVKKINSNTISREDDPIKYYWDKNLSELLTSEPYNCSSSEKERHQIYAAAVFSILHGYFNGNRRGEVGEYPMRQKQKLSGSGTTSRYGGGFYFGHNICAIAVDEDGGIIDFDFNNAELLNDSTQHAEVRLIKRLFALADAYETKPSVSKVSVAANQKRDYNKTLNNVTIYTSMESCAQCSGTMTLANIPKVVYLQSDPTQYEIGKIMYKLSRPVGSPADEDGAPLPISGTEVGFSLTEKIDKAFDSYRNQVGILPPKVPFFKPPGSDNVSSRWNISDSITSFVCTDVAKDIFSEGNSLLENLVLKYPSFVPVVSKRQTSQRIFTNKEVLTDALRFVEYAVSKGKRAVAR